MRIHSFLKLSALSSAIAALVGCTVPVETQGAGSESALPTLSPEYMPICTTCEPLMPAKPSSIDLGVIYDVTDENHAQRSIVLTVVAQKTGTLSATYVDTYDDQWQIPIIAPQRSAAAYYPAAANVTAGEIVVIDVTFVGNPNVLGVLSTQLSIYNEGARTLVPVTVTNELLDFPPVVFGINEAK